MQYPDALQSVKATDEHGVVIIRDTLKPINRHILTIPKGDIIIKFLSIL